jgi:hypothetical protein
MPNKGEFPEMEGILRLAIFQMPSLMPGKINGDVDAWHVGNRILRVSETAPGCISIVSQRLTEDYVALLMAGGKKTRMMRMS